MVEQLPVNSSMQDKIIAQSRAESVLDREIPLGFPVAANRIELGMTTAEYFRRKHGPHGPGPGRFFPLHMTAPIYFKK